MIDLALLSTVLPALLESAVLTVQLTLAIVLGGAVLAMPVAMGTIASLRPVRAIAQTYILFFRGTPALVQLFLLYHGPGQFEAVRASWLWPMLREPIWCVVAALSLNSAAYAGKTFGAALAAVSRGNREAARLLGLNRCQAFWLVEVPLAFRTALPSLGNDVILTCKATSLASTVTLLEITGTARLLSSETYAPVEVFIGAGAVYLSLNYALMFALRCIEGRFHPSP